MTIARYAALALFLAGAALRLHATETPRLVVVIAIDQMRYDYVERFEPWYVDGGFRRFLRSGAAFTNARYPYGVTYTAAGHATIGSGRIPAQTGVVGNLWLERNGEPFNDAMWDWYYDDAPPYRVEGSPPPPRAVPADSWLRSTSKGNPRYSAYDASVRLTSGESIGMSPAMLLTNDGLGDALKQKFPQSRVIGLAIKDRTGILLAGRSADAAYWFDASVGGFVSSSYYRPNPDVFDFNTSVTGYFPGLEQWTLSGSIPSADLDRLTFDPPAAWPLKYGRFNGTFPHPVTTYRGLFTTPLGNDLLADFARQVIITERLGTHDSPDLLFMSFTPTDYIGHYYGPDSREVAEGMVRLDRTLAGLLEMLDRRLGRDYTVVITSDHGVQANPLIEKLKNPGADTGRVDLRNAASDARTIAELPPFRRELEKRIARRLGLSMNDRSPIAHALIFLFEEPGFYLNWTRIDALKIGRGRAMRAVRDAALSMRKEGGFDQIWTAAEFRSPPRASATPVERLMRRSFNTTRSPDIIIALRPGWMWGFGNNETKHGQPVEADRHVPMMFWGRGIKPGRYETETSPIDIARSLGALLGVEAGGPDSRLLPCIESPSNLHHPEARGRPGE